MTDAEKLAKLRKAAYAASAAHQHDMETDPTYRRAVRRIELKRDTKAIKVQKRKR